MKTKQPYLPIFTLIIVVVIVLLALYTKSLTAKQQHPFKLEETQTPLQEIATDPNFEEVKGKLIDGFPAFPVFPGAILNASAKVSPNNVTNQGYRVKWTTNGTVPEIMKWYQSELQKAGWKYENNDDTESLGEQRALISKDEYNGFVSAEAEDEGKRIEINVDVRID